TLEPNDSYSQQWTELTNGNGWSIKLSPDATLDNILQYEYTFHNDGTIWYDLSDVDGNPWDGNWEITATSAGDTCAPKQQAYRYATDDAYGMQACPQDAEITVTLCSGESQNDGGAASASSSVAAVTSAASATSAPAESTSTTAAAESSAVESSTTPVAETTTTSAASVASTTPASSSATSYNWHTWHQKNVAATTLATSTVAVASTTTAPAGNAVVEIETQVVTEIVTATAYAKRHAHHPHKAAA
ncbi:hypothetical protein LTR53_014337, partial [Teratosphaeriaceae sp. CCFEE 6253]